MSHSLVRLVILGLLFMTVDICHPYREWLEVRLFADSCTIAELYGIGTSEHSAEESNPAPLYPPDSEDDRFCCREDVLASSVETGTVSGAESDPVPFSPHPPAFGETSFLIQLPEYRDPPPKLVVWPVSEISLAEKSFRCLQELLSADLLPPPVLVG